MSANIEVRMIFDSLAEAAEVMSRMAGTSARVMVAADANRPQGIVADTAPAETAPAPSEELPTAKEFDPMYRPTGESAPDKARRTKAEIAEDDELIELAGTSGKADQMIGQYGRAEALSILRSEAAPADTAEDDEPQIRTNPEAREEVAEPEEAGALEEITEQQVRDGMNALILKVGSGDARKFLEEAGKVGNFKDLKPENYPAFYAKLTAKLAG